MLDIAGDTWVGWQDTVADFAPDVALCMVGCLTEARPMAVARVAACIANLAPAQRPRRFLNVLPCDAAVANPSVPARLALAEAHALAAGAPASSDSGGCQVVNVRMGRVLGCLDADAVEQSAGQNLYKSPDNSGAFASNEENVPWVSGAETTSFVVVARCVRLFSSAPFNVQYTVFIFLLVASR